MDVYYKERNTMTTSENVKKKHDLFDLKPMKSINNKFQMLHLLNNILDSPKNN